MLVAAVNCLNTSDCGVFIRRDLLYRSPNQSDHGPSSVSKPYPSHPIRICRRGSQVCEPRRSDELLPDSLLQTEQAVPFYGHPENSGVVLREVQRSRRIARHKAFLRQRISRHTPMIHANEADNALLSGSTDPPYRSTW